METWRRSSMVDVDRLNAVCFLCLSRIINHFDGTTFSFFDSFSFEKVFPRLNGQHLWQLYQMKQSSPETYFKLIEKELDRAAMADLCDILQFDSELDRLLGWVFVRKISRKRFFSDESSRDSKKCFSNVCAFPILIKQDRKNRERRNVIFRENVDRFPTIKTMKDQLFKWSLAKINTDHVFHR